MEAFSKMAKASITIRRRRLPCPSVNDVVGVGGCFSMNLTSLCRTFTLPVLEETKIVKKVTAQGKALIVIEKI